ncbi:MAG TPA: hypothetical protein VLD67_16510, partial [Vicinamibacterales bacterium]|nr:hypothetical protein [Vicinamibacterales bacterium]
MRIALLAAGVALFLYLLHQLGPGAVVEMLGRIGWGALPIAAIYAGHQSVRALALTASVHDAAPLLWREALGIRLAGEAVQFLTFTGPFLSEPAKAWLLAGRNRTAVQGFATTLTEYLAYLFTGAALAAAALGWLLSAGMVRGGVGTAVLVLIAIMTGFLVASAWAIGRRAHLLGAV